MPTVRALPTGPQEPTQARLNFKDCVPLDFCKFVLLGVVCLFLLNTHSLLIDTRTNLTDTLTNQLKGDEPPLNC